MKDSKQLRMNITSMEDIKRLEQAKDIKYLNIDIMNPDLEVIYYLIDHGQKYSYSDLIDTKKGYIYVEHAIFKKAQLFILNIINHIPKSLSKLEIARYIYMTIGKNIGYDINILPDKNEIFSLKNINISHIFTFFANNMNILQDIFGKLRNNKEFCVLYAELFICYLTNRL